MKHLFFTALSILSISGFAQSQDTTATAAPSKPDVIAAPAKALTLTVDTAGTVVVVIPETLAKTVQKDWTKYASKDSKGKSSEINGEMIQTMAVNKNVSQKPFNLSARTFEMNEGVRLTVMILKDTTLTLTPAQATDRSTAFQKYVHDFAVMEYRGTVQDQLKAAQNKEKDMEKYMTKLIKEVEKSNKKIGENQRSIQKATDAIAAGKADIQSTNAQIETQKGMVASTAGDVNASKGANKTMDDLTKKRKELEKKNDSYGKDIDNYNKEIREEQRSIAENEAKEANQTAAIDKQKQAVSSVQVKLESIK